MKLSILLSIVTLMISLQNLSVASAQTNIISETMKGVGDSQHYRIGRYEFMVNSKGSRRVEKYRIAGDYEIKQIAGTISPTEVKNALQAEGITELQNKSLDSYPREEFLMAVDDKTIERLINENKIVIYDTCNNADVAEEILITLKFQPPNFKTFQEGMNL